LDIGAAIRIPPPFCTKTGAFFALALVKSHKMKENNTQNGTISRPAPSADQLTSRPADQHHQPTSTISRPAPSADQHHQLTSAPRGSSPQCAI
jgi:hypothetical protein